MAIEVIALINTFQHHALYRSGFMGKLSSMMIRYRLIDKKVYRAERNLFSETVYNRQKIIYKVNLKP